MKRTLILAALLLSIPATAQEKKPAKPKLIFHQGKPWEGCVLVDRMLQFGNKVQLWDCPPKGELVVRADPQSAAPASNHSHNACGFNDSHIRKRFSTGSCQHQVSNGKEKR